ARQIAPNCCKGDRTPAYVGTDKISGRLAFVRPDAVRFLRRGNRGRAVLVSWVSRTQPEARRRSLTDGAAFAERGVLGWRLSDPVGGRRTRLPPWLATGR